MNWRCLFGHKYKVLSYENDDINIMRMDYIDSYPSFVLRYFCKICHKIKIKEYKGAGYLTNEQFYEICEETNV